MAALDFEESGFRVSAPDPAFRFANLTSYHDLCGRQLKEMDVGWWEKSPKGANRLLLLELKGVDVWQSVPSDPVKPREHLVRTCVEKATDTLLMLAGAWIATTWGQKLTGELPQLVPSKGDAAIKLVFLIDIPSGHRELLLPVRDEIKNRLSGRLGIFGVQSVSVIDFEAAQRMGLPVARI